MKDSDKIIHLSDYIQNNKRIESVNTHEKIGIIEQPQANLLPRIGALGIDLFFIILFNSMIHAAYTLGIEQFLAPLDTHSKYILANGDWSLQLSVFLTIFWSYFFYTSYIMDGKTPGKKFMGLSIINEHFVIDYNNEHKITLRQAFQRASGYLLAYLSFGTFFIFNFVSEDNRGLSDYLSNTRTVDDKWLNMMLEYKEFASEEVTIDIRSLDKVA